MCPGCWVLREQVVQKNGSAGTALQTSGLVLGIVSILPLWPVMVASLVINIMGLVKAKEGAARAARWRSIVGLCLTASSIVVWGLIIAFAVG